MLLGTSSPLILTALTLTDGEDPYPSDLPPKHAIALETSDIGGERTLKVVKDDGKETSKSSVSPPPLPC